MSTLLRLSIAGAALLAPAEEPQATEVGSIVVRNEYWAKEGLEEEVYRHRQQASRVRARLGFYEGRVLRRIGGSDEQPDVVWECEYPSLEARQADLRALSETGEFEPVLEKMGAIIKRFERSVWSR